MLKFHFTVKLRAAQEGFPKGVQFNARLGDPNKGTAYQTHFWGKDVCESLANYCDNFGLVISNEGIECKISNDNVSVKVVCCGALTIDTECISSSKIESSWRPL